MKTYVFNAKNHSASITISAENAFDAIDELEEILKQDDVNDYRLDEESEEKDEIPERHTPFGVTETGLTKASDINQHAKEKRPTPEDCMHISKDLRAQLDEVSKNRYFTPDENTKKV